MEIKIALNRNSSPENILDARRKTPLSATLFTQVRGLKVIDDKGGEEENGPFEMCSEHDTPKS